VDYNFSFAVQKEIYKKVEDRNLKLYVFHPKVKSKKRAAILFFHGGSYTKNNGTSPARFEHHAQYFSKIGMVAICVDYRNANDQGFSPYHAIEDARSAVRWVREHAEQLGIDPEKVVVCGASSGGYTALCSILLEIDKPSLPDHVPNALVIFNAGVDGEEIINRLFPELSNKATELSPLLHVKKELPPMIWFVGTSDIIYESNLVFCEKWKQNDNLCVLHTYEGMTHGFFNYEMHENKPFKQTIQETIEFLQSLGFIESKA
jgi:acetyl esterase